MTRAELQAAATDREQLTPLLDRVAAEAAAGSRPALELLVWAVDELALARPAIKRVIIEEADVADVNQDVLIAVAEKVGGFRGDARFTTWLSQVARHKAIEFVRRKREEAELTDAELSDAARISSQLANRAVLHAEIGQLPDRYRRAVVLRDVQQLPYEQVAERLGLNLNTVKSQVARGRALVAAALGRREI